MSDYTLMDNLISAGIGILIGCLAGYCHIEHVQLLKAQQALRAQEARKYDEQVRTERFLYEVHEDTVAYEEVTPVTNEVVAVSYLTDEELELMAAIVHAEAGNQDLTGKRLVADVVLNRVNDEAFPDTVEDVIYQKNQFSPVANGSLAKAYDHLTPDDYEAVRLELGERLDYEIIYFTAGHYTRYGVPAYQHGDHYFSKGGL